MDKEDHHHKAYWRANLTILGVLLSIWFTVSFVCGIIFADQLDTIRIPGTGFKLGFWIGHQGSMYVFLLIILAYVFLMNRLDHKHGVDED